MLFVTVGLAVLGPSTTTNDVIIAGSENVTLDMSDILSRIWFRAMHGSAAQLRLMRAIELFSPFQPFDGFFHLANGGYTHPAPLLR
jgi:hypothetical protein